MITGKGRSRKLAIWLAITGLALAVAAGIGFVRVFDTASGDVTAIESGLGVPDKIGETGERSPTSIPSTQAVDGDPEPRFGVNEMNRLDELAAAERRMPVALRIDALGIDAPIDPYGIDPRTGQMDVPRNVRDVGWYRFGPSPGEMGSAVLAAHVDLRSQGPGVFFNLKELEPGALIMVTFDDGSKEWFETKARNTYQKDELPLEVVFSRQGAPVLTLITCGGGFSASEQTYDSNVVAYAVPVSATGTILPNWADSEPT